MASSAETDVAQSLVTLLQQQDHRNPAAVMTAISETLNQRRVSSLTWLASLLLHFEGKPYSLYPSFFIFEPMFATQVPAKMLWKTGRQLGKTQTSSARLIIRSTVIPYYSILTVTPRVEQIRRVSSNHVMPLIYESPILRRIVSTKLTSNVMQRNLANGSILHFTFALTTVERVRGISGVREVYLDEIQDLNPDFIPIIEETMSASPYGDITFMTGTPKTLDNAIQAFWEKSSQAEWIIRCGCGHHNIPDLANNALDMIQPQGLSCVKCGKLIDPINGQWVHAYGERVARFSGYHVPQMIMPMHCRNPKRWQELYHKKMTRTPAAFLNECMGESCDVGVRLITLEQIKNSCVLPWKNTIEQSLAARNRYSTVVMGVDWGGHGEKETSYTSISILGQGPHNRLDCLYTEKLPPTTDELKESQRVVQLFKMFRCQHIAHDYGGAGALREIMLIKAGIPRDLLMPVQWTYSPLNDIVTFRNPLNSTRAYYSADKTRALGLTVVMVKLGKILFPAYESCEVCVADFMSLFEDRKTMPSGRTYVTIRRHVGRPDDTAHSVAFASLFIWHSTDQMADLSTNILEFQLTPEELNSIESHPWVCTLEDAAMFDQQNIDRDEF